MSQYGAYYWCVKVTQDISPDNEIYLNADEAIIGQSGAIEFWRNEDENNPRKLNLIIPAGKWLACFAASVWDGHAVAVQYWEGEITRDDEDTQRNKNGSKYNPERGKITKGIRYDVMKRDNFHWQNCGITGKDAELVVDHILPITKGGKTELGNLQTLCQSCNSGKRDKV